MSQVKQWRSYDELDQTLEHKRFKENEFQKDASVLEDAVSRRDFIKVMGASVALAGVSGCNLNVRRPVQKITPYAQQPEHVVPGKAAYYATTYVAGKEVVGLIAESHEGRPTKIEGNPDHPESMGGSSRFQQASVLDLYDPDRLKTVETDGHAVEVSEFDAFVSNLRTQLKSTKGAETAIVLPDLVSPTAYRLLKKLTVQFPKLGLHRYEPINTDNESEALKRLLGKSVSAQVDYKKADRVISFDADFLGAGTSQVKDTRLFMTRRTPERAMNRLYVFEPHFTMTGTKADHRYAVKASEIKATLVNFAKALKLNGLSFTPDVANLLDTTRTTHAVDQTILTKIAKDVIQNKRATAIVVGARQEPAVHALAFAINRALETRAVSYHKIPFATQPFNSKSSEDSLASLVKSIKADKVKNLFILDSDPLFTSSSLTKELLSKVKQTIVLASHKTKTAEAANWVVPLSHYLESWGDAQTSTGLFSLVQPLIRPLYESLTIIEVLARLVGGSTNGYAQVRQTFRESIPVGTEKAWVTALNKGAGTSWENKTRALTVKAGALSSLFGESADTKPGLEVAFQPSYALYDGRFANNGWLQECPDPITKLTWDNAALINKKTAQKLKLSRHDKVQLSLNGATVESVIFIVPGHADDAITLQAGFGNPIGRVADGAGFDVYALTSSKGLSTIGTTTLIKQKGKYELATTQEHGSMEGRPIYRQEALENFKKVPDFASNGEPHPPLDSLYEEIKYDTGNQWGMAIDLNKCSGCNACLVGCQSENNIPIVGKKEVQNGREMHWIRIDRYFEGEDENIKVLEQPMTCLHCENAPCEQVCPVAATVHSKEGTNDMTYNRCVGTRYCADNCPTKVRRFNFFDYHQRNPQSVTKTREHLFDYMKEPDTQVQKQFNPNVTVRMRGVMEKCTYCIQRISNVKVKAKNENRRIGDNEIKSACQQACPGDAIVFGDINNRFSKVAKLKKRQLNYNILEQLHLKARTSYIASVTNPNSELVSVTPLKPKGGHH